jgi:exopolyphosphatase/guanosine-5'-triphosphate,3'-diphosphate pyrophosphatase
VFSLQAAVDVGSGSTKMIIARVNSCGPKIEKIVWSKTEKVDYKESMKLGKIEDATKLKGLAVLNQLVQVKKDYPFQNSRGVATAAFREATNGKAVVQWLNAQTGLNLQLISQKTEARLGFDLAQKKSGVAAEHMLMWDIGGASQQMMWLDKGVPHYFMGTVASVSFKDLIIKVLKPAAVSPNPMSKREVENALELAAKQARQLPPELKEKLREGLFRVVGMGSVHGKSLLKQTRRDETYTEEDLEQAIEHQRILTDDDLNSPFASTEVTNMILVLGFMRELGLHAVTAVDADLTEAVLLFPNELH